ncbi:MAG: hypothetical protein ACRDY0_00625 [Acidimicrobiales bacterium]
MAVVAYWFSIEVLDGPFSASLWAEAHGDALVESALASGAADWSWHRHTWGVVLELSLPDEDAWESFRRLTVVGAALEAVPDPVTGLIVYSGRGGSASATVRRRPRPLSGSGSAALPLPWDFGFDDFPARWPVTPDIVPPAVGLPALAGPAL